MAASPPLHACEANASLTKAFIYAIAVRYKRSFDDAFVVEMIQELEEAKSVDSISGNSLFTVDGLSFRGESATVKLAEEDGNLLRAFVGKKQTQVFNPFE